MRWRASVTYDDGTTGAFEFEEFFELGAWIEMGPDWGTIRSIQIVYLRKGEV
jgi:hypothetical protein